MILFVYGIDMMVGIGILDVDLDKYCYMFCSLFGRDEDSWGFFYMGFFYYKGDKISFLLWFG